MTSDEKVEDGEEDCGSSLPIEPSASCHQAPFSPDAGKESVLRSLDGPLKDDEDETLENDEDTILGEEVEDGEEGNGSQLPLEPNISFFHAASLLAPERSVLRSLDVPLEDAKGVPKGDKAKEGEED